MTTKPKYGLAIGLAAMMLAVGIVSFGCSKTDFVDDRGGHEGDMQNFQINTYATVNDDANARTGEDKIFSAMVYIYKSGTDILENKESREVSALTSIGEVVDDAGKLNKTWRVPVGSKDVYVVANPDAELKPRLTGALTQAQLQALLTSASQTDFNTAVNGIATNGMLMTGKKMAVSVSPESATVSATVEVTRRQARIDLMLRRSKELDGVVVAVKSVKFKDQICQGSVYPLTTPPTVAASAQEKTGLNVTVAAQQATAGSWSATASDYTSITNFYTFERAAGTKAACLEMTITIGGKDYVLPAYLCSTSIGTNQTGNDEDKPMALTPNRIYRVMGTLGKQSTEITLNILDWNDQAINGDIYGAELSVSQSRVLLDWYNFGGSYSTSIELSSTHNIEFLGYVCDGSPMIPAVADPNLVLPAWLPNNASHISGLPNGTSKTATINLTYELHNLGATVFPYSRPNIYLWVKAGNIYKSIEIVYDNSYLPYDVLRNCSVAWNTNTPVNGVVFAKKGNCLPSYQLSTAKLFDQMVDEQRYAFATDVTTDVFTSANYGTGMANTDNYITVLGAAAVGPNKCKSLGRDWYVPSTQEMLTLRQLQGYLGTSYMMVPGSYWTSTAGPNVEGGKSNASVNYAFTDPTPVINTGRGDATGTYFRCIINADPPLKMASTEVVADYWNWGKSFSTTVAFTSTDGAVSIKSIDNAGIAKNWLTAATLTGSNLGSLNLTYAPTAGNAGAHDDVVVTLQTTGGSEATVTVKYDNGYLSESMAPFQGSGPRVWTCATTSIQVAKRGNLLPSATALPAGSEFHCQFSPTLIALPQEAFKNPYRGALNTTIHINALGTNAVACNACRALGADWYLPTDTELMVVIREANIYLGTSYKFAMDADFPHLTFEPFWSSAVDREEDYDLYTGSRGTRTMTATLALRAYCGL